MNRKAIKGDRVTVTIGGWKGDKGRVANYWNGQYGVEFYVPGMGWLFGGHYRANQIKLAK